MFFWSHLSFLQLCSQLPAVTQCFRPRNKGHFNSPFSEFRNKNKSWPLYSEDHFLCASLSTVQWYQADFPFGSVGATPPCRVGPRSMSVPGWGSAPSPSVFKPATLPPLTRASKGDLGPGLMAVTIWGNVQSGQEASTVILATCLGGTGSLHFWLWATARWPPGNPLLWGHPSPQVGEQELKQQIKENWLWVVSTQCDKWCILELLVKM